MKPVLCCAQSCLTRRPPGLKSARLLCPWDSPGKNSGVGWHALLQGIFPTQGSNPGLPHCKWTLYQLSHQGNPSIYLKRLSMVRPQPSSQALPLVTLKCTSEPVIKLASWASHELGLHTLTIVTVHTFPPPEYPSASLTPLSIPECAASPARHRSPPCPVSCSALCGAVRLPGPRGQRDGGQIGANVTMPY